MYTIEQPQCKPVEKESIHSGQFMVSHFEAEEQDDEDNVAVPIPEVTDSKSIVPVAHFSHGIIIDYVKNQQQLEIDTSLSKLFQCMSLAYRQKLTSPKWNRFRGIRLRWKDKIRLNNVIWRCWHLQFIKKENTLICQFASPLDVDTHNKPEAVVLEGKYWKRKLAAVTAEYKKWRMFYRHNALENSPKDCLDHLGDVDLLPWDSNSNDQMHMMVDEDYMGLMSDTLFSTISNQPFAFPDSREIAKAGLADFIQPSLGPLQPNLDDYMDTFDPLHDFITSHKLPTLHEEQNQEPIYKSVGWGYLDNATANLVTSTAGLSNHYEQQYQPQQLEKAPVQIQDTRQTLVENYNNLLLHQPVEPYLQVQQQQQPPPPPPPYHSTVISKNTKTSKKSAAAQLRGKLNQNPPIQSNIYSSKQLEGIYQSFSAQQGIIDTSSIIINNDRIQVPLQQQNVVAVAACSPQQPQELQFKLPQPSPSTSSSSQQHDRRQTQQGYKFPQIVQPNIKFTSQVSQQMQHNLLSSQYNSLYAISVKEEKQEPKRRGAPRGRQRSRSNTREPIKRPPLISAVSDPQLLPPPASVLLTQLLTNNPEPVYSSHVRSTSHDNLNIKEENTSILPQPPPMSLIAQPQATPPTENLLLTTYSNSNSPVLDTSQTLHSPTSSQGSIGSPGRESSMRDRRVVHIHAEQKRRYNIKNGFDMIHSLIPHLNQNPNAKLSKAAMLQKGAEYIRQLRSERNQLKEEMDCLRTQIESLNSSISNCQSMLPATGAPISRIRDIKMQEMFDEYVKTRTMDNWKFWIFSLILRPLLNSFNNFVSSSSLDDLYSSTMLWIEQHCTLGDLRPIVLNSLKYLCTKTDILSDPSKLSDEAREMVQSNKNNQ